MAIPPHRIVEAAERYYSNHPEEKERGTPFLKFLQQNDDHFSRTNFNGHITTSGFVLHRGEVLLIHHNRLQRYLQPGGHFENDPSLAAGAQREITEETGLQDLQLLGDNTLPFDIDPHLIPISEKRGEPEHYHFDFRFLFRPSGSLDLNLQLEEVSAAKWLPASGEEFRQHIGDPTTGKLRNYLSSELE